MLGHGATLGGHVTIGDHANVGAFSGVHQFCRVGRNAIVGGYSVITQDVLPFSSTVSERENHIFGANKVGLERRGFSTDLIEQLQTTFRLLTRAGLNTFKRSIAFEKKCRPPRNWKSCSNSFARGSADL